MQWIILLSGLALLFVLLRTRKPASSLPEIRLKPADGMLQNSISAAAQHADGRGFARVSFSSKRLSELERSIGYLNQLSKEELLPAGRWLCENGRFLQEETAAAITGSKQLPRLPRSLDREPRVCLFTRELLEHTTFNITQEHFEKALSSWQNVLPMTEAELHALPEILQMQLLELVSKLANQCAQDQRAQKAAAQVRMLSRHGKVRAAQQITARFSHSSAFWEALMRSEESEDWLTEMYPEWKNSDELVRAEHERQSEYCLFVGNAITSLRTINRLPWHRILENGSLPHVILAQDDTYCRMDAESRSFYRKCASCIARQCRLSERTVCSGAVALARNALATSVAAHTGYYLLDDGLPLLFEHLQAFTPLRRTKHFLRKHACGVFRLSSWILFFLLLAAGFAWGLAVWILIPFASIFLYAFQQTVLRFIQARLHPALVPRLEIEELTTDTQVLVVCPTMLMSANHALAMVKRLSVMHEANPDEHLHFLLLGDFQDSLTATLHSDTEIIATAAAAIKALCEDTGHSFYYLQRERAYSPGEQTHHSRERKRGALETLFCLTQGRPIHDNFAFASIEPAAFAGRYRYVITLDSDTLLPPGSALRMVGAMMHPLQKRQRFEGHMRGVSILQPRMETAAHLVTTPLSRWLGGTGGTDPYNHLISDIDRDLFGSGTFMGKGIIDPEPFLKATQSAIPEGRILSHDLLEGALAGCACAGDILLYDGHPQNLKGFLYRLHRWTRGDWQLSPYLLPLIGYTGRKELDATARFKLWRNLFRSLIAPLRVLVILYAALTGRDLLLASAVLLLEFPWLFPPTLSAVKSALCRLAILPCEACLQADAIARTFYRLLYSRRHLLDWTTAAQLSASNQQPSMLFFVLNMCGAGLLAGFALLFHGAFSGLFLAFLWAAFPFLLPVLEQEPSDQQPTAYMREVLLRLARSTFTFFETALTSNDHGLPPDNVQIDPNKGIAHRTSPTNIGLYLCSLIAAEKLHLLTAEELALRMDDTVSALEALPKWHGLLFNWYDTQTLAPLPPAFVSSVDCGNLAVCLLTAAQGIRVLLPKLPSAHHGLSARMDTLCAQMQLSRLYDADADLFFIGVNTDENAPSASHYDLLASESRLLSFAAIMLRQVPLKHWYRLGRQHTPRGALISFSGTMFEYMMPLLFQPLVKDTLLEQSCHEVLRVQRRHRLGGAFGVSESGYHAFDPSLNYQYKAFGLPELALDADIQCSVLAPYASMLALMIDPKAAFRSLQRMQMLGLEGPLGLFEAADFSPSHTDGKAFAIVRSHMAHHQGMILCAICNTLSSGYLADLFSSLPRAQAYRLLLEERSFTGSRLIRHPLLRNASEPTEPAVQMQRNAQPLTFPVDAHVLAGGDTTLLIDAQGGGYLKCGRTMITRFHESCHLPSGIRIYLRDSQSGAYWTAADPYLARSVRFETSQAVFQLERFDIRSELRIWIDPLDGSCIHFLRLENDTDADRLMEVCSYLEPVLCPQEDAEAHPAFQKLFIQTERLERYGAAAIRRSRERGQPVNSVWHLLSTDTQFAMFRIQTDRMAFLGRGRSLNAPRAMDFPISAIADSIGDVVEPCLSLRGQFTLPAKGTALFCFVTHMPGEHESADSFYARHSQVTEVQRSYDSALTRGMVTTRYLRLNPSVQESISRLTGALAYAGQPSTYHGSNRQPLRSLWRFGISGDVPILLYTCCGSINDPLLRSLLDAHALWRMNGFVIDLVILIEECSKRVEMISAVEEMIHSSHSREWLGKRGGVYLLNRLSEADQLLLQSAARLILSAGGGTIEQQLNSAAASVRARPLYVCRSAAQWKQQLPPVEPLLLDNGLGGFIPETGDYQITLLPGRQTPAPWCNPLCTPVFGTLAAESGLLFTAFENSQRKQLTGWLNDAVSPRGEENFYLRDPENRLLWSLTRLPLGHNTTVRITHAPGETTYESTGYGILARMHCYTDVNRPVGIRTIHLQNESQNERVMTLFHSCRFATQGRQRIALSCEADHAWCYLPHAEGFAALCAIEPSEVYAASMPIGLFQGLWSNVSFALSCMEKLPQAGGDTAILCFPIRLKPGESCTLTSAVGFGTTQEELQNAIYEIRTEGLTQHRRAMRRLWEERLDVMQFDLPDKALQFLLGRWLPYQTQASRLWMRAGFYQVGGAFGFRDQLQDQFSLLATHPAEVRAHILHCAAHQFEEGDVQHWWHEPFYGVRTRISDDRLFLPYVTAAYLEATKDKSILKEELPYLSAAPLAPEEQDRLFEAESSTLSESLFLHCMRAIDSISYGAHDLPLMGSGDWNDGMNAVGGTNGESVWLGMFLCEVIRRFVPYCDEETSVRLHQRRTALMNALEKSAWDGGWYLRGWYHDGSKLGSSESDECRIDLLVQCWAVICGLSRERCEIAMENVWRLLYEKDIGLIKLFAPPFDGRESPGYIAGYLPGIRENGGQYTHAACWAVSALHQLGQHERAWELLGALMPTNHAATRQLAARYRVEPYVLAADVYANPQQRGRGGWTWYTGSASWFQTVVVQELLGLRISGNELRLRPVVPESWDTFRITYRYGSATYHLHAARDCLQPTADGEALPEGVLKMNDDGKTHEATFPMR